jgi:hypothetical protein
MNKETEAEMIAYIDAFNRWCFLNGMMPSLRLEINE